MNTVAPERNVTAISQIGNQGRRMIGIFESTFSLSGSVIKLLYRLCFTIHHIPYSNKSQSEDQPGASCCQTYFNFDNQIYHERR